MTIPSHVSRSASAVVVGGSLSELGSRGSCPLIASSTRAASRTVRVMGPTWSSVQASGKTPYRLTRPYVGLSPTTPQIAAGMRMEPEVSEPSAAAAMPVASATADPPLEPPGVFVVSHGLRQVPQCGLSVVPPSAYSCMLVLPTTIAPAAANRVVTPASRAGTKLLWIFEPIVVRLPPM